MMFLVVVFFLRCRDVRSKSCYKKSGVKMKIHVVDLGSRIITI